LKRRSSRKYLRRHVAIVARPLLAACDQKGSCFGSEYTRSINSIQSIILGSDLIYGDDADGTIRLGFIFYFCFPSANKPQEHKSERSTKPHRLLASNKQFGNQCFVPYLAVMVDLGSLRNCRHRHFTSKLHYLIATIEFTVVCLLLSMHNVVILLAEISITVIYFLSLLFGSEISR
jgi:hypothetical protein